MPDFGIGEAAAALGTESAGVFGTEAAASAAAAGAGVTFAAPAVAAPLAAAGSSFFSIGNLLSIAGTGFGALQQLGAGDAASMAGKYNQQVANAAADEAQASSQRTYLARQRQTNLMLSQNRARAAAGGGSVDDPSVETNAESIAGQGEFNSLTDLYNGNAQAARLQQQGAMDNYEGETADYTDNAKALSTVLSGSRSMFSRYASPFDSNMMQ